MVIIARMGRPGCFTKDVMHSKIDDVDVNNDDDDYNNDDADNDYDHDVMM